MSSSIIFGKLVDPQRIDVTSVDSVHNKQPTYLVKTFGCQMNVHDTERISGLLEESGYVSSADPEIADVIVFNTCAIRENADNKLYGTLSHLAPIKKKNPDMQIAVGGCLAQKDKAVIVEKAPYVDVVFGTHNINSLPTLLERAKHNKKAQVELVDSLEVFPSHLPAKRDSLYSSLVSISVGCNNTCTFCIVPSLRGKEIDRNPQEIIDEVHVLVDQGVSEVVLLGQNVNAYGMSFKDGTERNRDAFAQVLAECAQISGLERIRFTSPHPAEFRDNVLEVMERYSNICPSLHMPLQSGSDQILKSMRRSYRSEKFLNIVARARKLIPHAAITTDIIVGFPGETEADFEATLAVVRKARFAGAYTFQYSARPGTPAAEMENQIPKSVITERYDRLIALQNEISWMENKLLIGKKVDVLVHDQEQKKGHIRMTGRAFDGRLVHFLGDTNIIRPGDYVTTKITSASPHFLVCDTQIIQHRKTRAGDLYADGKSLTTPAVILGIPQIGIPKKEPVK